MLKADKLERLLKFRMLFIFGVIKTLHRHR